MIVLFLPVIWAIVSCAIALILYRSSKAAFDGDSLMGLPAKGVRLTGSIVIAVIIFMLIKNASPADNLLVVPKGAVILSAEEKRGIVEESGSVEAALMDLNGCMQMVSGGPGCADDANRARVAAAGLTNRLKQIGR